MGSISGIQMTPERVACNPATSEDTSSASAGVSAAPAQSTSWADGSSAAAARSSTGTPFCLVIRPTKMTYGRAGSIPCLASTDVSGSGAYSTVSIPFLITRTRSADTSGYAVSTSPRMPSETATTAAADSTATRSAQDESA